MPPINFPNPRTHQFPRWFMFGDFYYDARDIIYFGGDLTPENLRRAYGAGIFPWTIEGLPLPWFCPQRRAILEFANLHVGRTLQKERRKTNFTFSIDRAFSEVIRICGEIPRSGENGTWISDQFIESYTALHSAGDAHSVEVWDGDALVGGLYGVDAGGVFCGESMFHRRPNASKFALLHLINHLQSRGAEWLDIQVMTPHLAALGAKEISRQLFLDKLEKTLALNFNLF